MPWALRFWLTRIDAGAGKHDAARQIWTSPEHRSLVRDHAAPTISKLAAYHDAVRAWHEAAG